MTNFLSGLRNRTELATPRFPVSRQKNRRAEMGFLEHGSIGRRQLILAQFVIACLVLAVLTLFCYRLHLNLATASLLYVIVVVVLARLCDFVLSLVASVLAAVLLAYIAPPVYSFRIDDPLDIVAVLTFLVASLTVASLVSRLRVMREEALSSVNRKLVEAEERKSSRIGRELHEDISQRLALILVNLDLLAADIPSQSDGLPTLLRGLRKQIDEVACDLQVLAQNLHSERLEILGLRQCARSFCNQFATQHQIEIDFKSHELPDHLPSEVSLSLFRILQESLGNLAQHSGARRCEVELSQTQESIHLMVRDSGAGFNPKIIKSSKGLGLISMQERAKLVKGEFSIRSKPKHGTKIHAIIPIDGTGTLPRQN